ncbi:unnamed protein product, partial [Pylaiella littoralis]
MRAVLDRDHRAWQVESDQDRFPPGAPAVRASLGRGDQDGRGTLDRYDRDGRDMWDELDNLAMDWRHRGDRAPAVPAAVERVAPAPAVPAAVERVAPAPNVPAAVER